MRVLMVTYRYPPDVGGVEAFAKNLSDALSGLGVSVTVIAGADTTSTSNEEGVEVHRFELSRGHARGARFAARVRAIAKRLPRHDLVHAHIASAPAVAAVLVAGRWRAPVVVKPSSGAQGGGNLAAVISR